MSRLTKQAARLLRSRRGRDPRRSRRLLYESLENRSLLTLILGDDSYSTNEDETLARTQLFENDHLDGSDHVSEIVSGPAHGSLEKAAEDDYHYP
jgi:hypothetical protein